ncbi:hypothetical protein [Candidatus Avelusimicrobium facis]|uniref:hypothetical protein n=1 Tax=Candidatus Avelusimicrobium facis TaxID=3416203 RepID=UPI003D1065ED
MFCKNPRVASSARGFFVFFCGKKAPKVVVVFMSFSPGTEKDQKDPAGPAACLKNSYKNPPFVPTVHNGKQKADKVCFYALQAGGAWGFLSRKQQRKVPVTFVFPLLYRGF